MNNIKETIRPYVGYAFFAFIAIIFLGAVLTPFFGKASAQDDRKTLQESVVMAQADYDLSQSQALNSMKAYCNSWVELNNAKVQLANATKIKTDSSIIDAKACESITVPSSF